MPANKKYLTKSFHQRFAKITAAFLGGYLITVTFFIALATWLDQAATLVTMIFGGFILWSAIMVCTFLFRNGWVAWLIYLAISGVFGAVIFLSTMNTGT